VLDRIGAVIDVLAQNPLAGRARPELGRGVRSFPVGNYIVFDFPMGVDVLRVLSGYLDISPEEMS
jgi:toxin ParE1/3/4